MTDPDDDTYPDLWHAYHASSEEPGEPMPDGMHWTPEEDA